MQRAPARNFPGPSSPYAVTLAKRITPVDANCFRRQCQCAAHAHAHAHAPATHMYLLGGGGGGGGSSSSSSSSYTDRHAQPPRDLFGHGNACAIPRHAQVQSCYRRRSMAPPSHLISSHLTVPAASPIGPMPAHSSPLQSTPVHSSRSSRNHCRPTSSRPPTRRAAQHATQQAAQQAAQQATPRCRRCS